MFAKWTWEQYEEFKGFRKQSELTTVYHSELYPRGRATIKIDPAVCQPASDKHWENRER